MDLVLAAAFRRQADCVVWDEDSAAFLALAGAVAANGSDLVAVEQASRMAVARTGSPNAASEGGRS